MMSNFRGGGLIWPQKSDIRGEGSQKFENHLWMFSNYISLFSKKKIEERQPVDMEGQVKFAIL